VTVQPGIPTLEEIVADLHVLRERGLVRIQLSDLPALDSRAWEQAGLTGKDLRVWPRADCGQVSCPNAERCLPSASHCQVPMTTPAA